ncbi:MAG: hypothetical protein KF893_05540 [Caldilineaceae bacterium]|nr:hypothetical protein [Caldilineaceae bacterium]
MSEQTIKRIQFEIDQIDRLLDTYEELLRQADADQLDLIIVTAMASVLHSFYTGVENIFSMVAKQIDMSIPQGPRFHSELLAIMIRETTQRPSVISAELAAQLLKYLGFRHYYRHAYSFRLDWDEMSELVRQLEPTWASLKRALQEFLELYDSQISQ